MSEKLESSMSLPVILIITINSILGTGIFFLPAVGVRISGPASILAWAILSIIAIYISMVFAELTSMFPKSGGIYEFCKQAYGRFFSFIIGWMTIIAGNITIAMLVVGAIQYLLPFSGDLAIDGIFISANLVKIVICILFVLIFNYIAFKGIKTSATMLVAFGMITLGTLLALIIPGIRTFSTANFEPFFVTPIAMIFVTIFFIAETFFGWETATFLAAETKDGARVMPKVLIGATVIIAIISLVFVVISISAFSWQEFGALSAPLTALGMKFYGSMGKTIFTLLVYLSIIGSVAGWIVSAPRLLLAMAEDKLLFTQLGEIHPKNKTPHKAIVFQTILVIILIFMGFGSYELLLHLLLPLVLIMYSAVILSLLILRRKLPNHTRYFRLPFATVGSVISIGFIVFLIVMWLMYADGAFGTLKLVISLVFLGVPIYFLIELYHDPKAIIEVNDFFAYFALFTEKISLPNSVRREIFLLLTNMHNKTVLEYGCSVGTLTKKLVEKVGSYGRIYATDISIKHLKITEERVRRHKKKHNLDTLVHTLHDEDQMVRIHPSIPYADVVISVGMLGYIQDVKKVLNDIHQILPDNGEICFVEFSDFFKFIPNVSWLSHNETIRNVFRDAGFAVRVVRKKGLFWNYIYVYGIKFDGDVPII